MPSRWLTRQEAPEAKCTDSATGSSRDTIYNFTRDAHDIDLSGIGAGPGTSVNDALAFSGKSAQVYSVWWSATSSGVILRADVTGDRKADMEILFNGATWLTSDVLGLGAGGDVRRQSSTRVGDGSPGNLPRHRRP